MKTNGTPALIFHTLFVAFILGIQADLFTALPGRRPDREAARAGGGRVVAEDQREAGALALRELLVRVLGVLGQPLHRTRLRDHLPGGLRARCPGRRALQVSGA